jgi:uncharacterized membrane protein
MAALAPKQILVRFLVTGAILGVLDFIWLALVAQDLYRSQLGAIMLESPNALAALSFYLIYIVGVVVFVLNPALAQKSWQYAAKFGALFGLIAYATYDLTNLATLQAFTLQLTLIDLAWGTFLTSTSAAASYKIVRWLKS